MLASPLTTCPPNIGRLSPSRLLLFLQGGLHCSPSAHKLPAEQVVIHVLSDSVVPAHTNPSLSECAFQCASGHASSKFPVVLSVEGRPSVSRQGYSNAMSSNNGHINLNVRVRTPVRNANNRVLSADPGDLSKSSP